MCFLAGVARGVDDRADHEALGRARAEREERFAPFLRGDDRDRVALSVNSSPSAMVSGPWPTWCTLIMPFSFRTPGARMQSASKLTSYFFSPAAPLGAATTSVAPMAASVHRDEPADRPKPQTSRHTRPSVRSRGIRFSPPIPGTERPNQQTFGGTNTRAVRGPSRARPAGPSRGWVALARARAACARRGRRRNESSVGSRSRRAPRPARPRAGARPSAHRDR